MKMAPILSRPLGRLLIPTLSRAMSSGYLVHEPKYSFLKVKISAEMMLVETSPIFWQMSNNYNFSLFMLGDKGVSILNIEY